MYYHSDKFDGDVEKMGKRKLAEEYAYITCLAWKSDTTHPRHKDVNTDEKFKSCMSELKAKCLCILGLI